ncbi:MAG: hypothetical protein WC523_05290 [Patescibacteria group bacterium]|jgi:hypothetical protein
MIESYLKEFLPTQVDFKALANGHKIGSRKDPITPDEKRVLLNFLSVLKKEGKWRDICSEKYFKEGDYDPRRSDEGIMYDQFLKKRGWLTDINSDGCYTVTEELASQLPFIS